MSTKTKINNPTAVQVYGLDTTGRPSAILIAPDGSLVTEPADDARDAFGRVRVSEPSTLFDGKFVRGTKEPLAWVEKLTGTGSSTIDAQRSMVKLTVSANGDKVTRQSRSRIIYQPGRSMLHVMSMIPPAVPDNNVEWRVGSFDANDGIFLKGKGATISWVIRSSTSGAPVDIVIDQADWNYDKLDGTGVSGITLDPTKNMLITFDMQWLSIGRVRVGFDIAGKFVKVHDFLHSNLTVVPYIKSPNSIVRYEIEAVGVPVAATSLNQICTVISSEGGFDPIGIQTSISNERTGIVVDANYRELIAVRVKAADVDKVIMKLVAGSIMASTGGNIHWAVMINPTGVGAGAWVSVGPDSSLEYNVTRGAGWVHGSEDHIVEEGYFSNNVDTSSATSNSKFRFGATVDGVADILSLQAVNASSGSNERLFAALTLTELF